MCPGIRGIRGILGNGGSATCRFVCRRRGSTPTSGTIPSFKLPPVTPRTSEHPRAAKAPASTVAAASALSYTVKMSLRDRVRGVLGFPITPFKKDLSLDLDALARNVDEMASHPFCGLVAAGGTGELYSLTPDEVEQVVRITVEAVRGRMPVVAGTGYSTPLATDIARRVERARADCVLVLPPYYSGAPFEGLVDYYAAIGQATSLPLMI